MAEQGGGAVMQAADAPGERPHFVVLDGLRGVAALMVVIFHFSEMVIYDYSRLWIGHGWLAVDFFFCLSGFVLGYAYDGRMGRLGLGRFLKSRVVRLHPMVVLGTVLGLVAFLGNPFGVPAGYDAARVAVLVVLSLLMVPYGGMRERGRNLFGLNAPAWSLFWEYVASVVFGAVLWRARRGVLAVICAAGVVALCLVGHRAGTLSGGWSAKNFWDGGARVGFSFPAGLLVYRMGWRPRLGLPGWLGFPLLSAVLVLALVMPFADGGWVRELLVITVGFPLLVAVGAGVAVSEGMARVCRWSGELSYPLYMSHYAVIWMWGDYAGKHHLGVPGNGPRLWPDVAVGAVVMAVFGWVVLKVYDEPVRRWLRARGRGAETREVRSV